MKAFGLLRRLLGLPAQQPDIHIHITPGTVISPGDLVLVSFPHAVSSRDVAAIKRGIGDFLPAGAHLWVFADKDMAAIVRPELLQQVLRTDRGDRSSNSGPQPLCTCGQTPCTWQKPAHKGDVGSDGDSVFVPEGPDVPQPISDSGPDSHRMESP